MMQYCLNNVAPVPFEAGGGSSAEGRCRFGHVLAADTSPMPSQLHSASSKGRLPPSTMTHDSTSHAEMHTCNAPLKRIGGEGGLPRNSSLQFDFEIEEDPEGAKLASEEYSRLTQAAIERLDSLLELRSLQEQQLHDALLQARLEATESGLPATFTSDFLAVALQGMGYTVCLRKAIGGGPGLDCLQNLKHKFLLVQLPFDNTPYIIDIDFRAQFEVAHATPLYQALLDNMASEFIGTEDKLRRALQFLCDEMASAFHEQGAQLPPWRRARALLSKWCPRRSEDSCPSDEHNQMCGMELVKRSAVSEPIMGRWNGFLTSGHREGNSLQNTTPKRFPMWNTGGVSDVSLPWAAHAN